MRLWLDLETYSETPIKNGTHRYAESAEILLFAYALDDGPVHVWDVTDGSPMPDDLRHALATADEVWAHNSHFDRTVIRNVMPTLCPPIERWRDTMVQAMAHSLPGALGTLSEVMGLAADEAKDKRGKALVRLFCIPRKFSHQYIASEFATKAEYRAAVAKARAQWCGRASRETHPREWQEFIEYATNDIKAMRVIQRKLPTWNYIGTELALWHLDQKINDRGVMTDIALAEAAVKAVDRAQAELAERTMDLTLGLVSSTNKRQALIDYLLEFHGFEVEDLRGSTLEKKLEQADLDPVVRELLMVRMSASTSSTSKYKALLKAVSRDGRLRGLLQFCGAGRTGRWAGRVFQPQNLPRPTLKQKVIDAGIEDLKAEIAELIHDDIMALTSSCIRGCLVAPAGRKMPIADLSNIEGRALAWLAREQWKLDAFTEYDDLQLVEGGWISGFEWARRTRLGEAVQLALDKKGETIHRGHDLYALAYAKSFGVTPEDVMENKKSGDGMMRQVGKVQELACLGADTRVITNTGIKPLIEVTTEDMVWDGLSWVRHQGLIAKGVRPVVNVAGMQVTPDHLIRTGATWTQAQELASNESTLSRALATGSANLPFSVSNGSAEEPATSTWSGCSAPAGQNPTSSSTTTCARDSAPAAGPAPAKPLVSGASSTTDMPTSARTKVTAADCSAGYRPASTAATTRTTKASQTTGDAASSYTQSGAPTAKPSSPTSSACPGGMTQASTSTESTLTEATLQATCASSPDEQTASTSAPSETCSSTSPNCKPVFDLLNAGPRHRFTVLTDKGPLIVHNCGYEGGVGAFVTFALAYGIDLDVMAAQTLETADPDLIREARGMYQWLMEKKKGRNTYGLAPDTFVACDVIKRGWRQAHSNVATWWKQLEQAFRDAIDDPGHAFEARSVTCMRPLLKSGKPSSWTTIILPSGRRLCYPSARIEQDTGEISYMGVNQFNRKWSRIKTYSGKLAENVTQAFARDVLAYNMPKIEERGYEIILSVHDELLTETPDTDEYSSDVLAAWMANVPPWAKGLPLAAAGFETNRYRKD